MSIAHMLENVLAQNNQRLSSAQNGQGQSGGQVKTASAQVQAPNTQPETQALDPEKVAAACDFLAGNLSHLVDDRSPAEKVAEHIAMEQFLRKHAEVGVLPDMQPSTQATPRATPANIPPATVTPSGPGGQIPISVPNLEGGPMLNGNDSGAAKHQHQNPEPKEPSGGAVSATNDAKIGVPTDSANPPAEGNGAAPDKIAPFQEKDGTPKAASAMDWLRARSQPAPAGGQAPKSEKAKQASALAGQLAKLVKEGALSQKQANALFIEKVGKLTEIMAADDLDSVVKQATASGIPENIARVLLRAKTASNVDNPSSGGSGKGQQELQTAPGRTAAQSQGTHWSETPEQVQENSDPGRQLLSSNLAAIDFTQGQAKAGPKAELGKYLSEPALSSSTDPVLQKTLVNASAAGVKIAGALQKWASQSPENAAKLRATLERVGKEKTAAAGSSDSPDIEKVAASLGLSVEELTEAESVFSQLQKGGLLDLTAK